MGLILPHVQQASLGTNAGASLTVPGTAITASATPHTKGTIVEISSATARDWYGLYVMLVNDSTSATQVNNLYDILVGASGSEVALIPNILGTHGVGAQAGGSWTYFWPVFIPGGTRISTRMQSNVANKAGNVAIYEPSGFGPVPPQKCFQRVIAIGVDTATSGGLPHTSGSNGTFSTFVNLGSTLPIDIKAMAMMVGMDNNTNMSSLGYNWHVGFGGVDIPSAYTHFSTNNTEYISHQVPSGPIYGPVPAGTQLQMRVACTLTAQSLQYAVYGFA